MPPEAISFGPDEDLTPLFDRFVFVQSRRGYRFGIDAVLLARHVLQGPGGPALEVGTGCGVVSILLAGFGYQGPITAVEVQPAMADRARRNVVANKVQDQVTVVEADVREFARLCTTPFARIFSNPPYHRLGSGNINKDPERAIARHEKCLDVDAILALLESHLAPDGLASLLYPKSREAEIFAKVKAHGMSVVRLCPALPAPGAPPEVLILDIAPIPGQPCVVAPPVLMLGR